MLRIQANDVRDTTPGDRLRSACRHLSSLRIFDKFDAPRFKRFDRLLHFVELGLDESEGLVNQVDEGS